MHALFAHRDSDSVRDGLPTDVSRADILNAIVLLDSVRERTDVLERILIETLTGPLNQGIVQKCSRSISRVRSQPWERF